MRNLGGCLNAFIWMFITYSKDYSSGQGTKAPDSHYWNFPCQRLRLLRSTPSMSDQSGLLYNLYELSQLCRSVCKKIFSRQGSVISFRDNFMTQGKVLLWKGNRNVMSYPTYRKCKHRHCIIFLTMRKKCCSWGWREKTTLTFILARKLCVHIGHNKLLTITTFILSTLFCK